MPIALLYCRHLVQVFIGDTQSRESSSRFAAKYSLLWLELVLASVSTTIVETFVCEKFDGGTFYLNAELTLPCNGSRRRIGWVIYSGFALAVYPFGVPMLMFCLMFYNRNSIKPILQTLQEHDATRNSLGSVGGTTTMEDMALQLKTQKRRPSFVGRSEQQGWLMTKLDVYLPAAWWIHPVLLILRLGQSSLLALFRMQRMLVAGSSCIAVVGVVLVRETSPYRRTSE